MLLASKASDNTIRLWRTDTWDQVSVINDEQQIAWTKIAFHPFLPLFATNSREGIYIWHIDENTLFGNNTSTDTTLYTAAKVVLVGDTGVGKTGLGWRIAKGEFKEHTSTHGQQFWVVDELGKTRDDGTKCEAVLWDLAGQHVYRQVHSIFLDNVDAALVLFDPSNRPDPLKGAQFWLEQLKGNSQLPPTILVGGRTDRGAPAVSREELERFCKEYDIAGGYIGTSARNGNGLPELMEALKAQIPWDRMTTTVTTITFKRIKEFVLALKADTDRKGVLVLPEELRACLEASDPAWRFTDAEMMTAVGHLQTHGYVSILKSSDGTIHILLAPDLLVSLAASIVLQADRHVRDLGAISEGDLLTGKYQLDEIRGLDNEDQYVLLDAAVLRFVQASICFRETLKEDTLLIFPALIKQRRPLTNETPTIDDVSYIVRGRIENIYAMLVVLLGYTPSFTRINQWHGQAQYELGAGEICGFRMLEEREGEIELVLYFGERMPAQGRELFLSLFERFLYYRDVDVSRFPPVICPNGHRLKRAATVERAREGKSFAHCDECGAKVELHGLGKATLGLGDDPWLLREAASAQLQSLYEAHLVLVKSYRRGWAAPRCYVSHLPGQTDTDRLVRDLLNAGVYLLDKPTQVQFDDFVIILTTPAYKTAWNTTAPELAEDLKLIKDRLRSGDRHRLLSLTMEQKDNLSPHHDLAGCKLGDCSDPTHYPVSLLNLVLALYAIPHDHAAFLPLRRSLHEQWERIPRLESAADSPLQVAPSARVEPQPKLGEQYLDFELHITSDGQAIAKSRSEGEVSSRIPLQPPEEIERALELISQGNVGASLIRKVGTALYDWFFPNIIHTHLHQTEAVARDKGAKLRLRLRVDAPSLARLPLELAFRETGGYYLAVNPATVLSRYLALPQPPGQARRRAGPLHMLAIIAEPKNLPPVDTQRWETILREALARPLAENLLTLAVVREGTGRAISAALYDQKPDIVQVVAHGFYDDGQGWIALVDEATGEKWSVDEERFASLFLGHTEHLGLVCLATCQSTHSDKLQGLVGLAPRLVQSCGVPAVVAMQYQIATDVSQIFLQEFYAAIAARKPVDWAVQAARGAIARQYGYQSHAFATPVLLMRAIDGTIF